MGLKSVLKPLYCMRNIFMVFCKAVCTLFVPHFGRRRSISTILTFRLETKYVD
jgi:hypothetical protein